MTHRATAESALCRWALTAAIGLGLLVAPLPATAQGFAWRVSYTDADDQPTDLRRAVNFVAFVRNQRDFVMEVTCTEADRPIFRLSRATEGAGSFAGPEMRPAFDVRWNGASIGQGELVNAVAFREPIGAYQGPLRPRVVELMKRGGTVVVSDADSGFRTTFSLEGSAAALVELPCA